MLNHVIIYLNMYSAFSISEVYTFEQPAVRESVTLPQFLHFIVLVCDESDDNFQLKDIFSK